MGPGVRFKRSRQISETGLGFRVQRTFNSIPPPQNRALADPRRWPCRARHLGNLGFLVFLVFLENPTLKTGVTWAPGRLFLLGAHLAHMWLHTRPSSTCLPAHCCCCATCLPAHLATSAAAAAAAAPPAPRLPPAHLPLTSHLPTCPPLLLLRSPCGRCSWPPSKSKGIWGRSSRSVHVTACRSCPSVNVKAIPQLLLALSARLAAAI